MLRENRMMGAMETIDELKAKFLTCVTALQPAREKFDADVAKANAEFDAVFEAFSEALCCRELSLRHRKTSHLTKTVTTKPTIIVRGRLAHRLHGQ
jgi:hypothetical protein